MPVIKLATELTELCVDEALLTLIADHAGVIIYVKDKARRYKFINHRGRQYLGLANDGQLDFCDEDIFHPSCLKTLSSHDERVLEVGEVIEQLESLQSKDDPTTHHFLVTKKPIFNQKNQIIGLLGFAVDVTEMQNRQLDLQHMAITDPLTGLANRRFFMSEVERECARAKRQNTSFVLCVIDIDNFKKINDNYGHTAGDKVLIVIAELLKSSLRQEDVVALLGGEEFGLLLPTTNVLLASQLIKRLLVELRKFRIQISDKVEIGITVSVGISEWEEQDKHFESIYHKADKLMYEAKQNGKNRFKA
ncbi:GGDEF domain-containing protein [Shewanella sp. NIFS-20-20]|uniref:sensor domain-containing diguanylate cyclase n=1 Tax=Shewanella sp. NIFS-20-20 TaxID=2853806 RepID=UPI001C486E58|nr:GGDEF domain-containing protein [Shewanella sp. NIFS-20-20]MBV7315055.1 GGDEF domain-containing protein [Shewanella sp. NIFS-20-20]